MCRDEISACCLDNRKRKIIIGDISGEIKVYNPLNGSFMKSCVHDIQSIVVSLAYVDHSRRFLAGYQNGIMRLYDETNLDDCQILRNFDRFNFHSELTNVLFLEADRTVVTAGVIGEPVKLWEYDSGKCDIELEACLPTETIIAVTTLDPFPLIATSDSGGNIVVWGTRGCKWRGDKVTGFKNLHPTASELEPPLRTNGPRRIVPDIATTVTEEEETLPSLPENNPDNTLSQASVQSTTTTDNMTSLADKAERDVKECVAKWGPLSAATTITWDSVNHYLYTADEQGTLRSFTLERIIDELGGEAMLHGAKVAGKERRGSSKRKASEQSLKKDDIFGGRVIPHIFGAKKFTAKSSAMYRWGIQAHRETIIYCKSTPYGILTSATDNKVKMWDIDGIEVGSLLSCATTGQRSLNWDLKLDIDAIMHKESEQLDEILEDVTKYKEEMEGTALEVELNDILNNHTTLEDDKKTKFSRTSLRKRIEMSSRLLGLDFTNDKMTFDEMSEGGDSQMSLSMVDEISMSSTCSKSTRNALDEARNIHNQMGLEVKKEKAMTLVQIRHKECAMNKMVKDFEGRGISFPVLNRPNNPKSSYDMVVDPSIGSSPGQSKNGSNLQELEREEKVAKKCKKFTSYKNLEKCLESDHLPPLTKEERDKIRQTRKEQKRMRSVKESKKQLVKQKSNSSVMAGASGGEGELSNEIQGD
jgi:WD40 repeat protein